MSDRDDALLRIAEAIADLDHPIKVETAEWVREHIGRRDMVAADHDSVFALDDWRRCADRGIFGLLVPTDLGGGGNDLATALLTLEGLGYGCPDNGLTFAIVSQILTTQVALARFASPEQQRRYLPGLLDGTSFAAFAITEFESGSDAFSMAARAELLPDGSYRINADKAYITFGPLCQMAIVFAMTRPEAGSFGLSAFLVDTALPGVERGPIREKMGMRTTPFGDLRFRDVVVPADARLGREGAGASIFSAVLDVERSYVFAAQVGVMQRQLDETIEFVRHRRHGGRPLGDLQAVAHRVVAMKERHERARLFLYRAAIAEVTGVDRTMVASLAKIVCGDVGIESALEAATLHGAQGYVTEFEVERVLRDAVGGLAYSGANDVMRNRVARLLGLG